MGHGLETFEKRDFNFFGVFNVFQKKLRIGFHEEIVQIISKSLIGFNFLLQ